MIICTLLLAELQPCLSQGMPIRCYAATMFSSSAAVQRIVCSHGFAGSAAQLRRDPSHVLPAFQTNTCSRGFAAGPKLKPYSSYKERFRTSATGRIKFQRPGHRHRRFRKTPKRNAQLRKGRMLVATAAKTMQKLGFIRKRF